MSMRSYLTILLFVIVSNLSFGQQYKYKELVPLLDQSSLEGQLSMLIDHIAANPNEPNADFRIGLAHYKIFRKKDPLTEYQAAYAHADRAVYWLNKAKTTVTESEVRRENEYYAPLFNTVDSKGRPYVQFPVVQSKIVSALDSVVAFKTKMPELYRTFTKSVNNYGKAVAIFAKLNNEYKSLEDLLFLHDASMEKDLTALKSSFDSSVHYFDLYRSLLAGFPLASYQQKYKIKPIQVYRLNGLVTRLNFLTNDVALWDYGTWVDNVRELHKKEIVPLREKLEQNETRLAKNLDAIKSTGVTEFQKLDKDLIFNLNNLDRNSLPLALLQYKYAKQDYLLKMNRIGKDTSLDNQLELYSKLIQQNRVTDSLLAQVKKQIRPTSIQKHSTYFNKFYSGENGLSKFVSEEDRLLQAAFRQYQSSLKENLVRYSSATDTLKRYLKISTFNLPLFTEKKSINDVPVGGIATLRIVQNADGSKYLAGIHRMNKKVANPIVYVGRINPDGKTGWVKEYNLSPDSVSTEFDNYLGDIVSTQEGCGVIITSMVRDNAFGANHFVFLNEKGEEKIFRLKEVTLARKMLYQERSNTFTFLFKGNREQQDIVKVEETSLVSLNILGDLNWRRAIEFAGTVEDVVSVRDGFLVVGNYTTMRDASGKEYKTKVALGQSSPYMIKLGLTGDILGVVPMESSKPIFVDAIVKVNDESINLLGREAPFTATRQRVTSDKTLHMMTSYTLKQYCSDF